MNSFSKEPPLDFLNQKLSEKDRIWRETNLKSEIVKILIAKGVNISECGKVEFEYNDKITTIRKECSELTEYGEMLRLGNTYWYIYPKNVADFLPKVIQNNSVDLGYIVIIKYLTQRLKTVLLHAGLMVDYCWGENLGYFVTKANWFLFKEAVANSNITRF